MPEGGRELEISGLPTLTTSLAPTILAALAVSPGPI
jgi:hypothetical protein